MENLTDKQKELLECVNTTGGLREHLINLCISVLDSGATSQEGLTPSMCEHLYSGLYLVNIIADIEPNNR